MDKINRLICALVLNEQCSQTADLSSIQIVLNYCWQFTIFGSSVKQRLQSCIQSIWFWIGSKKKESTSVEDYDPFWDFR